MKHACMSKNLSLSKREDPLLIALSSAGIGKAVVHALVCRGAQVLIIDVNDDDGEALVILHGPKAMYMHCHVRTSYSLSTPHVIPQPTQMHWANVAEQCRLV